MENKRGKSLNWQEKAIKDQSVVSPSDIEKAKVFWITNASKESKDILDAPTE